MTARAEYVLPLRWHEDRELADVTAYLRRLSELIDVTVVDGSPEPLFARHAAVWGNAVRHVRPEPGAGGNGKVVAVLTGVRLARHEFVVVADDDVRYDAETLRAVLERLEDAELVHPQNVFSRWPWHARWDGARSLLNRATGIDYAGTVALRRSALLAAGGYSDDVLFENLELMRTIRVHGGRVVHAPDVFVARTPPATEHFVRQRVRQAYDDLAQPLRLARELALAPLALVAARHPRRLAIAVVAAVALAYVGRARDGARTAFPPDVPLWAPAWLAERAVCVWLALVLRATGGVPYAGHRIVRAGTPVRELRRRAQHQLEEDHHA